MLEKRTTPTPQSHESPPSLGPPAGAAARFDPARKATRSQRIAGGSIALALLAAIVLLDRRADRPWIAVVVVVALGGLGAVELFRMLAAGGFAVRTHFGIAASVALLATKAGLLLAGHPLAGFAAIAFFAYLFASWCVEVVAGDGRAGVERVAYGSLGFALIVLYSYLLDLLLEPRAPRGVELAIYLVLVSKANDIGGYLVGSLVGGRKLAPAVSAGKTWSGAIGGALLCVAVAALGGRWLALPAAFALGFGLAIAVATQFGDLSESLLKRACGFKDSGRLLPTFGGAFDVIDSLLFAAPCGYVLLARAEGAFT